MNTLTIDDKFINQYKNLIYSGIRKRGINNQDMIDDIFGNVIIRIMETKDNYNKDRGSVTTWLTLQIRSVISNYMKYRKRSEDALDRAVLLPEDLESIDSMMDEEAEVDVGSAGLAYDMIYESSLNSETKRLLYDHYIQGFAISELCKAHRKDYRTIRNMIDSGLDKLRREYEI